MSAFDVVLVGGGLQSGLIVLAALARQPGLRVAVVEAGARLGGNHTWCFHPRDVPAAARAWMDPLVAHRWSGYDVRFPRLSRTLEGPYCAITSGRFAEVVGAAIAARRGCAAFLGRAATHVGAHEVRLEGGTSLAAPLVVDARGPTVERGARGHGYQKFLGVELELDRPHGVERPVLMDAAVPQRDGFRFFYVLPFGPRRLMVEDTYFSRAPDLDAPATRAGVLDYAARFGAVARILREETGVLPMPWTQTSSAPERSPLLAGYRGGWFHPGTGYSLPAATRLASHVAERLPGDVFGRDLERLHRAHRSQARYAEHLNRLLFHFFEPGDMRNVFERFYALPEGLIHRFYALSMTWLDRARIVGGRPPRGFSLSAALAAVEGP
jgi:lycopene beta-cyclase